MRVAIMQPYFFPYIGYFQLINAVDRFIIGDNVQYIKGGWINRNRILGHSDEGFTYITVPLVKHSATAAICDLDAVSGDEWKIRILGQLIRYKKKSPYYNQVHSLVERCLYGTEERNISRLNAFCLQLTCDFIGIPFRQELQSQMQFDYSQVHDTCERPIRMCEQMGASEYINPSGGVELYDRDRFAARNIRLSFMRSKPITYDQRKETFEPWLSIVDVMMYNSPEQIRQMLIEYELF